MADHTLQSTIEIAGSLSPSLQSAINAAVSRLEEMSKETLEAAGASAQLAAKISTQETVLKNLEQGYADYIVTGQEGTEEAEQLASTIQELSGELTENRGTLDAAEKAARALSETMDDAGGEAETLRSTISKQEGTLQQLKQRYVDVATEQGETSDEARELARQIQDLSSELHENKTKLSDAEYAADKLDNSLEPFPFFAFLQDIDNVYTVDFQVSSHTYLYPYIFDKTQKNLYSQQIHLGYFLASQPLSGLHFFRFLLQSLFYFESRTEFQLMHLQTPHLRNWVLILI